MTAGHHSADDGGVVAGRALLGPAGVDVLGGAVAPVRATVDEERPSAFGVLVERGMLRPGEVLHSLGGRHKARVRADGTLVCSEAKGSIHQVGAQLEGAPSCNGWTYWHFKRDGKVVPIDVLRQQIRAEMVERPN